ncbi:uncharacterized protein EHS24_004034 [Apiotrichum porosum]|uniref:Uncharacterized protein n=1 Tax=Apiotrichum porosum TaxID=105984 RepID=A0A427Y437_9TREE|nr:uncharacterized protein EHS24_004034 [Apiotrichum porosum]RSH85854.1 hypothetical protein EHS24_004034 [Apiotrichum porosum]
MPRWATAPISPAANTRSTRSSTVIIKPEPVETKPVIKPKPKAKADKTMPAKAATTKTTSKSAKLKKTPVKAEAAAPKPSKAKKVAAAKKVKQEPAQIKQQPSPSPSLSPAPEVEEDKPVVSSRSAPKAPKADKAPKAPKKKAPKPKVKKEASPSPSLSPAPDVNSLTQATLLQAEAFPHIFDAILGSASIKTLLAVRAASRGFRDVVDCVLASHLVVKFKDRNASLVQVTPRAFDGNFKPCPTEWDTLEHWLHYASKVRVLDLCADVAPYVKAEHKALFTKLQVLRIRGEPHMLAYYSGFTAQTLVVCQGPFHTLMPPRARQTPLPIGTTKLVFNLKHRASYGKPYIAVAFGQYEHPESLKEIVFYVDKLHQKKRPRYDNGRGPEVTEDEHYDLGGLVNVIVPMAYCQDGDDEEPEQEDKDEDMDMPARPPRTDTVNENPCKITFVDIAQHVNPSGQWVGDTTVLNTSAEDVFASLKQIEMLKKIDDLESFVRFLPKDEYRATLSPEEWDDETNFTI